MPIKFFGLFLSKFGCFLKRGEKIRPNKYLLIAKYVKVLKKIQVFFDKLSQIKIFAINFLSKFLIKHKYQ